MAKAAGGSASNGVVFFFGLIVLGLVITYWYVIVGAAVLVGMGFLTSALWRGHEERKASRTSEHAAISARADYEHQQFLNGDLRGLYGQFQPARL